MVVNRFSTANEAFEHLYKELNARKESENGTKKMYNCGFYIDNSIKNHISTSFRNWNPRYAEREWDWYMSQNRSVAEIKKFAPMWDRMHNGDDIVNSNYGFLWNEKNQLSKTIDQLSINGNTRQAWITIFDGKNKDEYTYDTPCTLSIGFMAENNMLCMTVLMRSNDLWYGFCNDQYCFSKLQIYVAEQIGLIPGWYYHYSADMHLYKNNFLPK